MSAAFGGSIPDEVSLNREEVKLVLFALDDATEASPVGPLRSRLEAAARLIVEKLMPDLPDL
ncbi:MAG: hypothetical protein ABIV94_12075 [Acidimicrobiales bacterium]